MNLPQENKSFGKIFVRGRYYEVTPLEGDVHLIKNYQPEFFQLFESNCNENMFLSRGDGVKCFCSGN